MPMVTIELEVPELETAAAVDPARTIVLVVDLQNQWCHPDGGSYGGDEAVSALHSTAALIDHARSKDATIMWTQHGTTPDQASFSVYGRPLYCVDGTWDAEISEPLRPLHGEKIIHKNTYDSFVNTDLEAHLRREGIRGPNWTFIVVGLSLTGCVHLVVNGLAMREFKVMVPLDCVAPRSGDRVQATLHRLGHRNYSLNVSPLAGWECIAFDGTIKTNEKGLRIA